MGWEDVGLSFIHICWIESYLYYKNYFRIIIICLFISLLKINNYYSIKFNNLNQLYKNFFTLFKLKPVILGVNLLGLIKEKKTPSHGGGGQGGEVDTALECLVHHTLVMVVHTYLTY